MVSERMETSTTLTYGVVASHCSRAVHARTTGNEGGKDVMDGHETVARLHILLVEHDPEHAAAMRHALTHMETAVRVSLADRLRTALAALADPTIACVVTDLRLPDADGLGIVRTLRAARRALPVIVVTGAGSAELAVAALKLGAADYVSKHAHYVDQLPCVVREAVGRSVLAGLEEPHADPGGPTTVRFDEHPFVATTASMAAVLGQIERAARSTVTVLMQPGKSEHGYEFTPADVAALATADLVVYVGLGLEGRIEATLKKQGSSYSFTFTKPAQRSSPMSLTALLGARRTSSANARPELLSRD